MVFYSGGMIWVIISGWEDWCFEIDERFWFIMWYFECYLYGEISELGYCIICFQTCSLVF